MAFPDNIGPRTQPAWTAILEHLADGDWHTRVPGQPKVQGAVYRLLDGDPSTASAGTR